LLCHVLRCNWSVHITRRRLRVHKLINSRIYQWRSCRRRSTHRARRQWLWWSIRCIHHWRSRRCRRRNRYRWHILSAGHRRSGRRRWQWLWCPARRSRCWQRLNRHIRTIRRRRSRSRRGRSGRRQRLWWNIQRQHWRSAGGGRADCCWHRLLCSRRHIDGIQKRDNRRSARRRRRRRKSLLRSTRNRDTRHKRRQCDRRWSGCSPHRSSKSTARQSIVSAAHALLHIAADGVVHNHVVSRRKRGSIARAFA